MADETETPLSRKRDEAARDALVTNRFTSICLVAFIALAGVAGVLALSYAAAYQPYTATGD